VYTLLNEKQKELLTKLFLDFLVLDLKKWSTKSLRRGESQHIQFFYLAQGAQYFDRLGPESFANANWHF
jgi:hypothetical protein